MQMGKTTYGAGGSRRYGRRRLWASVTHCHRNRPLRFCRAAWSGCGVLAALSIIASTTRSTVARTPLLQFLKALSSDVRHCQARDISVGELMAGRLAAPSRREFVAERRGDSDKRGASGSGPCCAFQSPHRHRRGGNRRVERGAHPAGLRNSQHGLRSVESGSAGGCSRRPRYGRTIKSVNGAGS